MSAEETKAKINLLLSQITELIPDAHIQVMASWNENGCSISIYTGIGNWYARQGLAHEFINQDIAQENARQIAEQITPPPDESDGWKEK